EDVAPVEEAEVARLQEGTGEGVARALRVLPVAAHDARAGEAHLAHGAVRQRVLAGGVVGGEDAHLVVGELVTAGSEADRVVVRLRDDARLTLLPQLGT